MKQKCIDDPECSGFSWPAGNPIPSSASGCRKNNIEQDEGVTGWGANTHQYIRCDCMSALRSLGYKLVCEN